MKQRRFGPNDAFIEIDMENGFRVVFSAQGASVYNIYLHDKPMLGVCRDLQFFLDERSAYYGKTVGPFAGRIENGKYTVNGKQYSYLCNEPGVCCHCYPKCYAFMEFEASVEDSGDKVVVHFHREYEEKEYYPAKAVIDVEYALDKKSYRLDCHIRNVADADAPVRIANHPYFNLGGEPNAKSQRLLIDAEMVTIYDDKMMPIGLEKPVGALSFDPAKPFGTDVNDPAIHKGRHNGYDHGYRFKDNDFAPARIILESDQYLLEVHSDYNGVQIYSNSGAGENFLLDSGFYEEPNASIVIEMMDIHMQPEDSIVPANTPYVRNFAWIFTEKKEER